MIRYKPMAEETARRIRRHISGSPEVGLITGTGLGAAVPEMSATVDFDYEDLPHFPRSTVAGHPGQLSLGRVAGRLVLACKGRFHLYEGYDPLQVTFPVRVMQELGVTCLVVTNAAGGLNPDFVPGDIMHIRDHINLTGVNPLCGPNEERWGPRFPDMSRVYDPGLEALAHRKAQEAGFTLRRGVYTGLRGPSLETPAEVRFLKIIGTDAVGFSTVMETIAGAHAGMRVLGLSTITNVNNPDRPVPATLEEIVAVASAAAPRLATLVEAVIAAL
ncbi:MAG TPA: purine-nucleoside phosphorylase [Desulfobacteraceae bacterium]|nr:purine-nucleoside phosphorylase [Deltaproteobacteria bacterium]RLB95061.1 MAG: purine-nucleoside phosphorylase [Deltaproteobacteria bacterium]HDI61066.1 purine-nucleoside phosphorylase [Desulfobacteraceae bacterium]